MPKTNLLYRFENFLDQPKLKKLNLRFDQLDIFSFYQGEFVNLKSKKHGHVVIKKTEDHRLLNMKVMDQIIFSCAFHFNYRTKSRMSKVPEPLARGYIEIEEDRFVLHYTLESIKKDKQLQFCFIYQKLQEDFKT